MRQNYQRTNRIQPKGRRSTATNDKSLHKIGQRGKSNDNAQRMESMAVPIVRHCCCGRRCRRYHRQSSAFGHLSGAERIVAFGRGSRVEQGMRMLKDTRAASCWRAAMRPAATVVQWSLDQIHFKVEQNQSTLARAARRRVDRCLLENLRIRICLARLGGITIGINLFLRLFFMTTTVRNLF